MLKNKVEVNMKNLSISIRQYMPLERVSNLLCSAFDPASSAVGYWCHISDYVKPISLDFMEDKERKQVYRYIDYPLNKGGAIIIQDNEGDDHKEYQIGLTRIKKGLAIMAKKFPTHYADFLAGNEDNNTADVFIQCCAFGDVIYG